MILRRVGLLALGERWGATPGSRLRELTSAWVIPLLAATVTLTALLSTAPSIGYARDEGFYFQAAERYGHWVDLLLSEPTQALGRDAVDTHFRINAEHPILMKLLFFASHRIFHEELGWISTPGTAYRFPGMLMAAIAVMILIRWGSAEGSTGMGVMAASLFMLMPRVFHHAHLACFDVPVATMILATAAAYRRAQKTRRWTAALWLGIITGLLFLTKHNGWLVPPVLTLHWLITEGRELRRTCWVARARRALPILSMAVLAPLILVTLWPWLWFDTFERLQSYVEFHLHHDYYNMEFLGHTYWRPPMPRLYAWVMTLATVPLVTLLLGALGAFWSWRGKPAGANGRIGPASRTAWLWGLMLFAAYAPWLSSDTPIFGGTKHWLPAYPFLCLFAGVGYRGLAELWSEASRHPRLPGFLARSLPALGTGALLIGPVAMTRDSVPFGLTAYTPIVGGAPGAATLGLNRTFWGYTTESLVSALREAKPKGATLFVSDTALQSFAMMQEDQPFLRAWRPTLDISRSSVALYHHEPHMGRVEYQLWEAYGLTTPTAIASFQGVPVVWMYVRPDSR